MGAVSFMGLRAWAEITGIPCSSVKLRHARMQDGTLQQRPLFNVACDRREGVCRWTVFPLFDPDLPIHYLSGSQ